MDNLSESHKNQIAAIHDIHAEDMAKKDATIHDYSVKIQDLRKTSNIVSYKFIILTTDSSHSSLVTYD